MKIETTRTELRKGRHVVRKTYSWNSSSSEKKIRHLLFVHGSCAGSVQFEPLIDRLGSSLEEEWSFHAYDALGCGASFHNPSDWKAFSEEELFADLFQIYEGLKGTDEGSTVVVVAHSHGTSQAIDLCLSPSSITKASKSKACDLGGMILISGALLDGPHGAMLKTVNPLFYCPVWLLRLMQPTLTDSFVGAAYHDDSSEALKEQGRWFSNANDIGMCKAFYRQTKWCGSTEAQRIKVKTLVLHGEDDKVLPVASGRHLADNIKGSVFETISHSSHQVFEEYPGPVADIIARFLKDL